MKGFVHYSTRVKDYRKCSTTPEKCEYGAENHHPIAENETVSQAIEKANEKRYAKNTVGGGKKRKRKLEPTPESVKDEEKETVKNTNDVIDDNQNDYSHLTVREAEEILDKRTNAWRFQQLLNKRDVASTELDEAKEATARALEDYRQEDLDEDEKNRRHEVVREKVRAEREAFYNYLHRNGNLEEYKNETALVAARISEDAFEEEYEGDTFGNAIRAVEYPSGSREWLEQRQLGIGGSDVGAILKLEDNKYTKSNYQDVLKSKTEAISDEEVERQQDNNTGFSGPAGRGNAWEPLIAKRFADENPQYDLLHSKASWVNKDRPWQFANYDGILRDKKTGEYGILEIKTASDASKWDEGIPNNYRAQVLHYLNATGYSYAHVAVQIDDHEYRQYSLSADDPLTNGGTETYEDRIEDLEKFHENAQDVRDGHVVKKQVSQKSVWDNKAKMRNGLKHLAAYRQESADEIWERMEERVNNGESRDAVMRSEYASFDPSERQKDTVSIDLETTGAGVNTGEILEIGIIRSDANGNVVDEYQGLYSVDKRGLEARGTGAEDVHNISVKDLEKRKRFSHPDVQKRVADIMGLKTNDTVMLAHNAAFENKWLRQELDDFHDADLPVVDTMHLSRYHDHDAIDNTLSSFAERHGIQYVDAHRALNDARMTTEAYENFIKEITGKE